jgi:hypothetical protein
MTSPQVPASVIVQRDRSVVGLPVRMFFTIDGERIYAVWIGQAFTFNIDPGEYIFGYEQGFNTCRRRVVLEEGRNYFVKLTPVCDFEAEERTYTSPPIYAVPVRAPSSASTGSAPATGPTTSTAVGVDAETSRELWLE